MARFGIVLGLLLCGLSLVAMVYAPAKGATQFIPLMAGIPLLFLGVTGLNPHRRRNSVWASVATSGLGSAYGIARFFQLLGHQEPMAIVDERVVVAMTGITLVYLAIGTISLWTPRPDPLVARSPDSGHHEEPPASRVA